jgi:hypothetical protein
VLTLSDVCVATCRHSLGCALGAVEQSVVTAAQAVVHVAPWASGTPDASASWVDHCVGLAAAGARAVLHSFYSAAGHTVLADLPWSLSDLVQRQLQLLLVSVARRLTGLSHDESTVCAALAVQAELGFEEAVDDARNPLIPATPRLGSMAPSMRGSNRLSSESGGAAQSNSDIQLSPYACLPADIPSADSLPPRWQSVCCDESAGQATAIMCLFLARVLAVSVSLPMR